METRPILEDDSQEFDVEGDSCESYSGPARSTLLAGSQDAVASADKFRCRTTRGTLCRASVLALVVVGALLVVVIRRRAVNLFESASDRYFDSARASLKDAVQLYLPPDATSRGCVAGVPCMCDRKAGGLCYAWRFEVGDVLIFGVAPETNTPMETISAITMDILYAGACHSAFISEVNGPALTDIVVTESLKGPHMAVYASSLQEVLAGRQYTYVWLNKVDRAKFPNFVNRVAEIGTWSRARVGEPFDTQLMVEKSVPFPWRGTDPHWIEALPGCSGREKALNLYKSGGLGKWFCSQLVAWTLAFPGGLNTDYGSNGDCVTPPWDGHVEFLEVGPGDLIHQPFYDASGIRVPCEQGCDIGVGA